MRARWPFAAIALLALTASSSSFAAPQRFADTSADAVDVDVELVLAVDVSYSMDPEEQKLQREGYLTALTSKEFLSALKNGAHGKIAITYFEWANFYDQKVILPWRLIDGPESADAVANEIAQAPYRRSSRTSIAGALTFGSGMFEHSGYHGTRRVIDVSGDGPNNNGPLVTQVRDDVLAKGITINGLPIMLNRPNAFGFGEIANLDQYYEDCVVGGPNSFVIPIREPAQFKEATRQKLVQEVAEHMPVARVIRVSAEAPRVSCTIGENQWRSRWGN